MSASGTADAARLPRRPVVSAQAFAALDEAAQTAVRGSIETAVHELARQGVHDGP